MGFVPHCPLLAGTLSQQPTTLGQILPSSGGVRCPVRSAGKKPTLFQAGRPCLRTETSRVCGEPELLPRTSCGVLHTPGASHKSADQFWSPGEGDQPWSGLRTALFPQTTHPSPLCLSLGDCWWVEEVVFLSCEGFDSEHCIT